MDPNEPEPASLIRDYLAGRLSPAAAEAFEARYFRDDALAEELDLALQVRAAHEAPPIRLPPLAPTFAMGEQSTLRGEAVALALTVEASPRHVLLTWPAVKGADRYRVQIFHADGAVVVDLETDACTLAHEQGPGPDPDPGGVVARVQALDALRSVVADSGLVQLGLG